jgi:phosphoserine phosphatase RsbU/P
MKSRNALVVSDPGAGVDELVDALSRDGVGLVVSTPVGSGDAVRTGDRPDVVLFGASLGGAVGYRLSADLTDRFGAGAPRVVAFADTAVADVAELAREGFDYLLPPYPPEVVRSRMCLPAELEQRDRTKELAMYERELQIGREIQQGFLPIGLPVPPGWQIEVFFRPAREVAGDFYDGFEMVNGRRVGFVIADVCDKGVGSALFMALIRSLIRHSAGNSASLNVAGLDVEWAEHQPEAEASPASTFERGSITTAGVAPLLSAVAGTSVYMTDNHLEQGYFATLFFGVLDPASGDFLYINCGHNPPLIRRAGGELVAIQPTGPALGMLAGSTFRVGQAHLDAGDLLYLYTDGVSEARNPDGEQFGEERLNEIIRRPVTSAADVLARVGKGLGEFVGTAEQFDDITMMAVHRPSDADAADGTDRRGARR